MISAQHLADKHVIPAITIDVGHIHAHRRSWDFSNAQAIDCPESTLPLIDPDPVRRSEVITHIEVRSAIVVKVMEHRTQSPIERRVSQRLAIFIQKSALRPGHMLKAALTDVAIERVWFA